MDIMTISSLAGLGRVPSTVRTYGDAIAYLGSSGATGGATLYDALAVAGARVDTALAQSQISQGTWGTLNSAYQALDVRLTTLYSRFSDKPHGDVLSSDDAATMSQLDADVESFANDVLSAQRGKALKVVGIVLGGAAAAGLLIWATNFLPSYGRRSKRRRR